MDDDQTAKTDGIPTISCSKNKVISTHVRHEAGTAACRHTHHHHYWIWPEAVVVEKIASAIRRSAAKESRSEICETSNSESDSREASSKASSSSEASTGHENHWFAIHGEANSDRVDNRAWHDKGRFVGMATGSSTQEHQNKAVGPLSEAPRLRSVQLQDLQARDEIHVPRLTAAAQVISDPCHSGKMQHGNSIYTAPSMAVARRRRHRRSFEMPSGVRQLSAG